MLKDRKTEAENFRGQRALTSLLLMVLAAGMLVVGFRELSSARVIEENTPVATAGVIPVSLLVPGTGFEVNLAETGLNQAGQLAGTGWLKSSAEPGEPGTAIIGIDPDWPLTDLKPGDRFEIGGQKGERLVFEVTSKILAGDKPLPAVQPSVTVKELKLLEINQAGHGPAVVISARLVITNQNDRVKP